MLKMSQTFHDSHSLTRAINKRSLAITLTTSRASIPVSNKSSDLRYKSNRDFKKKGLIVQ